MLYRGIPTFDKTKADEQREEQLLQEWVDQLAFTFREEMTALYQEMEARETVEAKIYKALDNLEAVIQHNESVYALGIEHIHGRICPDEQLQIISLTRHQKINAMHPTGDEKCQEFSHRKGNPGSVNTKNPRKNQQ